MQDKLTPLKAIRQHCLSCAGRHKDVRECPITECKLHNFRSGHNPSRKKVGPGRVIKISPAEFQTPPVLKTSDSLLVSEEKRAMKESNVYPWTKSNPGVFGEGMGNGQKDINAKGNITIKRLNEKEIVITLKSEN